MALLLSPRVLPRWCGGVGPSKGSAFRCSSIAVDAAAPVADMSPSRIRWGSSKLQGPRSEMEDDVVVRSDPHALHGFSYAAVFDGHAGSSSVRFLRDELYKECSIALQGGLLLTSKNFAAIRDAIEKAFESVDKRLLSWLEQFGEDVDSGATATVMFVSNDVLIISHVGDSSVVISRNGKAEVLTNPHRPYGNSRVSLDEVKRIRAAGGWIVDGRICGDISVSRAFGDVRFKTGKNEMLVKGVEEGRWTEKFVSRIQFKGDLVTSSPDIYQLELGSDVELILVASDGLWDYMKSSDAVSFVRNQLRQHGDVQIACEALARAALDQRSQDNISIVIADLGRTDWLNLPAQGGNFLYEISQAFATVGIVSLGIWMSSFLIA
ncbi:protein phosphatase 2C 57 [Ananas comosus]|uniref:protein-serine/threonine phosphatase n=1 Tax=Ananas comosus TaxID=4615 RepID=A0A6P5FZA0_ANACO|nr:protein phosphatase 2C 57 [Ananas comosus]